MSHHAHIYTDKKKFIEDYAGKEEPNESASKKNRRERWTRKWTAFWNQHIERNGNVPLVMKCGICSGAEHRHAIKNGTFKVSTREEQKLLKEEVDDAET